MHAILYQTVAGWESPDAGPGLPCPGVRRRLAQLIVMVARFEMSLSTPAVVIDVITK